LAKEAFSSFTQPTPSFFVQAPNGIHPRLLFWGLPDDTV